MMNQAIFRFTFPDKGNIATHAVKTELAHNLNRWPFLAHPVLVKGTTLSRCMDNMPGAVLNICIRSALNAIMAIGSYGLLR